MTTARGMPFEGILRGPCIERNLNAVDGQRRAGSRCIVIEHSACTASWYSTVRYYLIGSQSACAASAEMVACEESFVSVPLHSVGGKTVITPRSNVSRFDLLFGLFCRHALQSEFVQRV